MIDLPPLWGNVQPCDQINLNKKTLLGMRHPEMLSSDGNFEQLAGETSVLLSLRCSGGSRGGSLRRDAVVVKR